MMGRVDFKRILLEIKNLRKSPEKKFGPQNSQIDAEIK